MFRITFDPDKIEPVTLNISEGIGAYMFEFRGGVKWISQD